MRQQTLAGSGFERFRKRTRRETFLLEMDQIIPWHDLCKVIKPFYPKQRGAGRPPVGIRADVADSFSATLVHLSDPAVDQSLGICCTATKPGYGETPPTRARAMSLRNMHRVPKTSPTTKAPATGR